MTVSWYFNLLRRDCQPTKALQLSIQCRALLVAPPSIARDMSSPISQALDGVVGRAQITHGESLSTFFASLTTSAAILGASIVIYVFLNVKVPDI